MLSSCNQERERERQRERETTSCHTLVRACGCACVQVQSGRARAATRDGTSELPPTLTHTSANNTTDTHAGRATACSRLRVECSSDRHARSRQLACQRVQAGDPASDSPTALVITPNRFSSSLREQERRGGGRKGGPRKSGKRMTQSEEWHAHTGRGRHVPRTPSPAAGERGLGRRGTGG